MSEVTGLWEIAVGNEQTGIPTGDPARMLPASSFCGSRGAHDGDYGLSGSDFDCSSSHALALARAASRAAPSVKPRAIM